MTVAELIRLLQEEYPHRIVSVWDPKADVETLEVYVARSHDGYVHISNTDFPL
jgi:hypothetical protein